MSLLFPDRFTMWLTADRVTVLRCGKGRHRRYETVLQLDGDGLDPCALVEKAVVHTRQKHAGAARFELVLSSAFAQMLWLPMQPALTSSQEEALFVRFRFEEVFGKKASEWDFSWDPGLPCRPVLACAVKTSLLKGVKEVFHRLDAPLLSVEPWLVRFVNTVLGPLKQATMHCMVAEGGQLFALQTQAGEWTRLHQTSLSASETAKQLQECVQRELLLYPLPDEALLSVYGAAALPSTPPSVRFVRCQPEDLWLRGGATMAREIQAA